MLLLLFVFEAELGSLTTVALVFDFLLKNCFLKPSKLPKPLLFVTVGGAVDVAGGAGGMACWSKARASKFEFGLVDPDFIFSWSMMFFERMKSSSRDMDMTSFSRSSLYTGDI
jgi:hypothetical protein